MELTKIKNRNRAVSPLIATVLLIGIVIAAVAMIFLWMNKFVGETIQKYSENINVICDRIQYTASLDQGLVAGHYEITINNQGNDNIYQFNLKFKAKGTSVSGTFSPKMPEGTTSSAAFIAKGTTGIVEFVTTDALLEKVVDSNNNPKFTQIEITPVLLGVGKKTIRAKLTPCTSQTQTLKLA